MLAPHFCYLLSGGPPLDDQITLSPAVQRFIEAIGGYFTQYGLPRVAGRLLGLVMVVDRPLTLDDMAAALGVSRASISTNIRLIESVGFVERTTVPKDRRDYYQCSSDPWDARVRSGIVQIDILAEIAKRGLAAIEEGEAFARTHLEDLLDFCEFLLEEERGLLQRWRAHRERRAKLLRDEGAASS
jgi:DNA-binding transcriptional regulator GbsR (MarR family)